MTWPARLLAGALEWWHRWISPALPAACRFEPTCSVYSAQALRRFGFWRGTWLTLKRLARCHPWGGQGHDPVVDSRGG